VPSPQALAAVSPALLQSLDLGGARARALVRAAREVALGRIDLHDSSPERAWRRLRALPGIGAWTVEMLALFGQGRYDQVPAGDVGLLKLVGRHLSGGDPRARAQEQEVRDFFRPYGEWSGLAMRHTLGGI
jgi:3-methyladenine DNA glycosylase/8-oxoguanine DNA glycosylase